MNMKKSHAILHVIDEDDSHYIINYGANNIYTEVDRGFNDWDMGSRVMGRDITSSVTTLSGDVESTVVMSGSLDESVARLIASSSRRAQEAEEKASKERDLHRRRGLEDALDMLLERYETLYPGSLVELLSPYFED